MATSASSPPPSAIVTRLRAAGCVFAEDEARLLISAASTPADLAAMVARRAAGQPLEHVVGWAKFCGLRIAVDPGVFVPRRRSEFLVRQAVGLAGRAQAFLTRPSAPPDRRRPAVGPGRSARGHRQPVLWLGSAGRRGDGGAGPGRAVRGGHRPGRGPVRPSQPGRLRRPGLRRRPLPAPAVDSPGSRRHPARQRALRAHRSGADAASRGAPARGAPGARRRPGRA